MLLLGGKYAFYVAMALHAQIWDCVQHPLYALFPECPSLSPDLTPCIKILQKCISDKFTLEAILDFRLSPCHFPYASTLHSLYLGLYIHLWMEHVLVSFLTCIFMILVPPFPSLLIYSTFPQISVLWYQILYANILPISLINLHP